VAANRPDLEKRKERKEHNQDAKIIFSIETQQDYTEFIEVIAIPSSFN
jgi:hypothetical protein